MTCIEEHRGDCSGATDDRPSLSGTGTPIARCDYHWAARLRTQEQHDRRYPTRAPDDFDPGYAGERWDED